MLPPRAHNTKCGSRELAGDESRVASPRWPGRDLHRPGRERGGVRGPRPFSSTTDSWQESQRQASKAPVTLSATCVDAVLYTHTPPVVLSATTSVWAAFTPAAYSIADVAGLGELVAEHG